MAFFFNFILYSQFNVTAENVTDDDSDIEIIEPDDHHMKPAEKFLQSNCQLPSISDEQPKSSFKNSISPTNSNVMAKHDFETSTKLKSVNPKPYFLSKKWQPVVKLDRLKLDKPHKKTHSFKEPAKLNVVKSPERSDSSSMVLLRPPRTSKNKAIENIKKSMTGEKKTASKKSSTFDLADSGDDMPQNKSRTSARASQQESVAQVKLPANNSEKKDGPKSQRKLYSAPKHPTNVDIMENHESNHGTPKSSTVNWDAELTPINYKNSLYEDENQRTGRIIDNMREINRRVSYSYRQLSSS